MRVNVYAEEMTDRIEIIGKEIDGHTFTGLRFYLELPATVNGVQHQGPFMHRPGDDDSSAVTFWGKRDLRAVLRQAQAELDQHYGDPPRPRVVVLCGSTRFFDAYQRANYEETMAGRIVLSVGHYPNAPGGTHGETVGCTPEQKAALDELHKRKIDMADEILVLNVGGYIGESTRGEIIHAQRTGKPIRWLEPVRSDECIEQAGKELESWLASERVRTPGT